jgi:predicted acylesterase/phospholipase RssA
MKYNLNPYKVLLSIVMYLMLASYTVHGFIFQNRYIYSVTNGQTPLYGTETDDALSEYRPNELSRPSLSTLPTLPTLPQPPIASLSLSGGGAYGAFQVGCLKALAEENIVKFDTIDTVSVGGLLGAFLAQFNIKDQYDGISKLEDVWNNIKNNRDIYKHWKFSFLEGAFVRNGLYNPKPLAKMIGNNLNARSLTNSDVDFNAATTNIKTGEMVVFDKNHDEIANAVLAGCSIPVMFPPVKIQDDYFVDAGIKRYFWGTDLHRTDKPVVVITTSYQDDNEPSKQKPRNMVDYGASVIRIFMDSLYADDMSRMINRENVYIIRPKTKLHGKGMSFKNKDIVANIDIGYKQTMQMIRDGELNVTTPV